ncbi:glycosyltransferase [Patescibacteria group bacterium]|nr:glycosyltransferase [Patescibacteria group bacterium]
MKKLSIIIPAKNEGKRIAKTLSNYASFFSSQETFKPEIIVVISNSSDSTADIVDDYSSRFPFVRKVFTSYDLGKGGAVALGFKNSTGDYVGFTDADGAVPASEFFRLSVLLHETPWLDVASGSRTFEKTKMSLRRRILSKVFNLYVRFLFNLPYKDTQCGAKVFRDNVALSIANRLSNTGWAFDVNILLVARYLNFKVLEFPVSWSEKEGSKFSVYTGLVRVPIEFLKLKVLEIKHRLEVRMPQFVKTTMAKKASVDQRNILIFAWRDTKHFESGGSEIYVHNIAKRLAKKNNVTLFTSQPGNLNDKDIIDDVKVVRRGNFVTVYFWAVIYYILYFSKRVDFIIDVENGIPFFSPLFARKPRLMIVHHVHKEQWFKQFMFPIAIIGYFLESVLMPIVYKGTSVVTVSPSSLIDLKKLGFPDKKIYLVYNSIPNKVGGRYRKSGFPLITYVGRVKSYKRIEIAVKTSKILLKDFPNLKLVIGGTGDHLESIKKLINKLRIQDSVETLGFVSEKEKWEYMQKAWVFLMPSMKEGWGITTIEAASCGTPAVGFNVPGIRDSIRDGLTGLLADNEKDFTEAVDRLLKDSEFRKKLGENARKWAGFFTWGNSAKVFEEAIGVTLRKQGLLSNRIYPWDLDVSSDAVTSLADNFDNNE